MKDVIRSYKTGWLCFLKNWKVIVLIFVMNIILAYIAIGPLAMALEDAFAHNGQLEQLIGSFDYAIVSDFLRLYRLNVYTAIEHIIPLSIVYLLFYCFMYGGLAEMALNGNKRMKFPAFFSSCAKYFWKMVLLAFLVIVISCIILFILFQYFAIEGFNPFELETETGILNRFWISIILFAILSFLLTTFRDFSKISIVQEVSNRFIPAVIQGARQVFKPWNLVLSFLNVSILIIVLLCYQYLKTSTGEFSLAVIILGQVLIIFRIAYKLIRLASFSAIQRASSDV